MKVVFRTDSSVQIGSGHVMRCLTLAEQLREMGVEILFICRELIGNLNDLIVSKGFNLCPLPAPEKSDVVLDWNQHASWLEVPWEKDANETTDCLKKSIGHADWLIVDHYALDTIWESRLRLQAANIMVIDDLADRPHDCNMLLDQNLYTNSESRYQGLVTENCLKFFGPRYALLRKEFIAARRQLRKRNGTIRRILIFFGGVDVADVTSMALKAITSVDLFDIEVDVVVGAGNQHREKVKQRCKGMPNVYYYCQVENMAELMSAADIAVGAGGSTTWERCFLGLPCIVVTLADNQVEAAQILSQHDASCNLGSHDNANPEKLAKSILNFINKPELLVAMSKSAFEVMGNYRGADAVLQEMLRSERVI